MPIITMTFPHVNNSVQVNDTSYYQTNGTTNLTEMGTVTAVTSTTVSTNISGTTPRPTANDFILFSKDNKVNIQQLTGYYAEVKMENNRNSAAEIFSVGSEIFESSK